MWGSVLRMANRNRLNIYAHMVLIAQRALLQTAVFVLFDIFTSGRNKGRVGRIFCSHKK